MFYTSRWLYDITRHSRAWVVPARNEGDSLRGAFGSLVTLDTACEYEVLVVDGD
ncbi:hypothetical protein GRS80_13315 [Natrialba sp. INN-245]|nr:hypothetical protein [Natrialba sp. INN-245]